MSWGRIFTAIIEDINIDPENGRAYLQLLFPADFDGRRVREDQRERLYADEITTNAGVGLFSHDMSRIPGARAEFTIHDGICVDIHVVSLCVAP